MVKPIQYCKVKIIIIIIIMIIIKKKKEKLPKGGSTYEPCIREYV